MSLMASSAKVPEVKNDERLFDKVYICNWRMISNGNHVKFARFVLLVDSEETKT